MRSRQQNLFDHFDLKQTRRRYGRTQHGGASTRGHRKLERPLSTKRWIHLVLKSDKAKGFLSFLHAKNKTWVEGILRAKAKKFGVRIDQMVNMGNHFHLKIKISSREGMGQFLKSTTTQIARKLTGARRGKPFGRFWQGLAFTRVLMSSLEELHLRGYFEANRVEAQQSTKARQECLRRFNAWVHRLRTKTGCADAAFSTA